jgi:hypothetical protein
VKRRSTGLVAPGATEIGDIATTLFTARFVYHEAVVDEVEELIQKWREDVLAVRPDLIKAWEASDIIDETAESRVIGEMRDDELWLADDENEPWERLERSVCPFCGETIKPGEIDPCSLRFRPGPEPDDRYEFQQWSCHAACLAASFEKAGVAQFQPSLWKK